MQALTRDTVSLGLTNPKSAINLGNIVRAAGCFAVSSIFYTGQRIRYAKDNQTDTHQHINHLGLVGVPDLLSMRPAGAKLIAVELAEGACPLPDFQHPPNSYYLFGPEDGSLSAQILNACDHAVYIPTNGCLNLAATVNVLLYDRQAKQAKNLNDDDVIRRVRDTNNNLSFTKNSAKR